MFKKLTFLFVAIPVAVILIILSVANRYPATLSLDPFNTENPAFAVTLPFFVYIFAALMVGLILGSMATWWRQGKHRKLAREEHREAVKWQGEAEAQKARAEELAKEKANDALGLTSDNQAA